MRFPKKHISYLSDIDDKDTLNYVYSAIDHIVEEIGIKESGYRVVVNKGPDACQSVFHVHFHILGGEQLSGKMG